jgi:hypothetical protein
VRLRLAQFLTDERAELERVHWVHFVELLSRGRGRARGKKERASARERERERERERGGRSGSQPWRGTWKVCSSANCSQLVDVSTRGCRCNQNRCRSGNRQGPDTARR